MKIVLSAQDVTRLTHVPRWNILPGLPRQSVADHTFLVSVICLDIFHRYRKLAFKQLQFNTRDEDWQYQTNRDWLMDSGRLLQLALLHDAAEVVFGDPPTPVKNFVPGFKDSEKNVTTQMDWPEFIGERGPDVFSQILKFADTLEALRFLSSQPAKTDLQKAVIVDIADRLSSIIDAQSAPLLRCAMQASKEHLLDDSYSRLNMTCGIPLSGEVIP